MLDAPTAEAIGSGLSEREAAVFEADSEEEGIMQRPQCDPAVPLFSAALIGWSVLQGAVVLALTAGIYLVALDRGLPEAEVRSLTFFVFVFVFVLVHIIFGLILVNRSFSFSASIVTAFRRRSPALRWVMLVVTVMLGVTPALPFAERMLRLGPLHADDLAVIVAAGLAVVLTLEFLKSHWHKQLMT